MDEGLATLKDWLFYVLITATVLNLFFFVINRLKKNEVKFFVVRKLLSKAEENFYWHLIKVLSSKYQISYKVRVADVINHRCSNRKAWLREFNKLSQKHFDFVVSDGRTLEVAFAVELDDSSHDRKKRKERDQYLNKICQEAGLKLIRIRARGRYKDDEIRALFEVRDDENGESLSGYSQENQWLGLQDSTAARGNTVSDKQLAEKELDGQRERSQIGRDDRREANTGDRGK